MCQYVSFQSLLSKNTNKMDRHYKWKCGSLYQYIDFKKYPLFVE